MTGERLRRGLCATVLAALMSCAAAASDGPAPALKRADFAIPECELPKALKLLSAQADVSIVFDNRLADGVRVRALSGAHTVEQAISHVLEESGLRYERIDARTWAVAPRPPRKEQAPPPAATVENAVLEDDRPDEIIVLAHDRSLSALAGPAVLYVLDGEQIRLSGAANVAEPIFELPVSGAAASSASTARLVSASGLNLADLRGLGPQRTLVLVNGRRYVSTSGGAGAIAGVDLNSIPSPFVKDVEIINQGAGAVIGDNAVAGAVNIVLRNDIEGFSLTADGGVSERGDASEYSFSVLGGKAFGDGRGRAVFGATFAAEPSLQAEQRALGGGGIGLAENPGEMVLLPLGTPGDYVVHAPVADINDENGPVTPLDVLSPSLGGSGFAFFSTGTSLTHFQGGDFTALPDIERLIGYGSVEFEAASNHVVYAEFHVANSDIDTRFGSPPVLALRQGGSDIRLSFTPLAIETGARRHQIDRNTYQATGGVEGAIGGGWRYDAFYQFGRNRNRDVETGVIDGVRLATALQPAACAAFPGCTPIDGTTSLSLTGAQTDFILAAPLGRTITTREQVAHASLSGPLYRDRGVDARLAFGVEHRRVRLEDMPDDDAAADRSLNDYYIPGASGGRSYTDLFINVNLPLLADAPGARFLELSGAYRFTVTQDGDNFSNISGDLRWAPVEAVEFYAQTSHGGRAPNAMELFSAGPDVNGVLVDPCGAPAPGSTVADNCAALGASGRLIQENVSAFIQSGGNPDLREERVHSRLFGVSANLDVLSAAFPGALTVAADWRHLRIEDAIFALDPQNVLTSCFESVNLSSAFCGVNPSSGDFFIRRDGDTRQLLAVEAPFANGAELRMSGLDARLQYRTDLQALPFVDAFALDVLYTYTHRVRSKDIFTAVDVRREGLIDFPRHQFYAAAGLEARDWKTIWTLRRRGEAVSARGGDARAFSVPSVFYVDAALQRRVRKRALFYAGVENLFNRRLPTAGNVGQQYFFEYYDVIGRRFFTGLRLDL